MGTKEFKVEQMKFNKGMVRIVNVPYSILTGDINYDLNKVFEYGQNEVHAKSSPSVSVGDIIEWENNDKYIVKPVGFEKISKEFYDMLHKTLSISIKSGNTGETNYSTLLYNKLGIDSLKYC